MNANAQPGAPGFPAAPRNAPPRRAVLDLAPLELDCMNTLWPMGEGTVREIRDRLAVRRPRAYTTIMTIMDRLARKGVVERRKSGRAYTYRPNLSADAARSQALAQVIENFFAGSKEDLLAHLAGVPVAQRRDSAPLPAHPQELPAPPLYPESGEPGRRAPGEIAAQPRARAAAASSSPGPSTRSAGTEPAGSAASGPQADSAERIDDTLL